MIYDGHASAYSLKYNRHSLILSSLPLLKPHKIKSGKGSKEKLYKIDRQVECATTKGKPQMALLMVKPNTSHEANPFCPITLVPSYASGIGHRWTHYS